eukprot:Unigene5672_Nuclearia_a/m.17317 Unigene5672_Nuclearia_a/g.17317  ORF Unigene5672_Nuclearia_a/g.17317 Unigene5672_Nuclearia_a/m.17317 type:complete len:136 (+) Unigene5672_Nuclearia_a:648-1055(+)
MAYAQVAQYGMSERVGNLSYELPKEGDFATKPFSEETSQLIDEEARGLIERAFERTVSLLREHRDKVERVALRLLDKEVLSHADMVEIVGRRPFENDNRAIDLGLFEQHAKQPGAAAPAPPQPEPPRPPQPAPAQ